MAKTYWVEDAGEPVSDEHVETQKENQHRCPVFQVSEDRQVIILFSLLKNIRKATIILMAILRPAPVQLSDNSAESKQANNFESAEQWPDTLGKSCDEEEWLSWCWFSVIAVMMMNFVKFPSCNMPGKEKAYIVIMVKGVKDIIGEAGEKVDQEPWLETEILCLNWTSHY